MSIQQWVPNSSGRTRQVRVAETVAAELRERILNGTLPDGRLPKQEDLGDMFGVSGPSLREALRILESEGLITVRRGKLGGAEFHLPNGSSAAYAIGLTLQGDKTTVAELAEAIRTFEPACAVMVAMDAANRTHVADALRENIERTTEYIDQGAAFTHLAREFHEILVDGVANPAVRLLTRSLETVWSAQEELWANNLESAGQYPDKARQQTVIRAHRKIADSIAKGDTAAIQRAIGPHLKAVQEQVLTQYGTRVVDAASAQAVAGFRRVRSTDTRRP